MKVKSCLYIYTISILLAITAGVLTYKYANNYKILFVIIAMIWSFSLPVSFIAWYQMLNSFSFGEGVAVGIILQFFGLIFIPILLFPYTNFIFYKKVYEERRTN